MEWHERIVALRTSKGLKRADLSRASGVSYDSLNKYERGEVEQPRGKTLKKIAAALGTTEFFLRYGTDAQTLENKHSVNLNDQLPINNTIGKSTYMVPLFGSPIGGPKGEFDMSEEIGKLRLICSLDHEDLTRLYAVRVRGDFMEPKFFDGEAAVCDPGVDCLVGDFVLAQIRQDDGKPLAYVKRLVRYTTAELVLEQFKPAETLTFDGADVVSVHPILWSGRWR
jgi:phage repressor protein C with HTH and peptisase S24 domain